MHRFRWRGWAAVGVALAASAVAPAADPPPADPPKSLFARLNPFGAGEQPGPRVRPAVGPLSEETMLAVLQAEKDAYTRRLDVCHRLREIAMQRNDDSLEGKANELEKQATATYRERVARLGGKSVGPLPPLPPAVVAKSADTLDKALGSGVAKTPLDSAKPAAGKTATAKAEVFKVVNP